VREAHAATSERGFHKRLTEFLGWDGYLLAPRFNDVDCPLYLETIFPLLYVEQKLGWGRLPARYPTWLGIRDVARRTVEFLLGLDAYAIAIERVAVQDEIGRIRTEWASLRSKTNKLSSMAAEWSGNPDRTSLCMAPRSGPQIVMPSGSDWVQLRAHLARLRERLGNVASSACSDCFLRRLRARKELASSESQLAERERSAGALVGKIESDSSEVQALQKRIEGIEDDLRKYKGCPSPAKARIVRRA